MTPTWTSVLNEEFFVRLIRRLSLEFPEDRSFVGSKITSGQLTEQFVFSSVRWARIKCDQRELSSLVHLPIRMFFIDGQTFVARSVNQHDFVADLRPIGEKTACCRRRSRWSFTFTSVPSNSNRKCELGCIINQTLARVRWLVKITSQVRPARVELFTQVKNN